MAFKMESLKETLGEDKYQKLLSSIKQTEGEAVVIGLTTKEVGDDEVELTEKDEELEVLELEEDGEGGEDGDDIELSEEDVAELETLVSAFEAGVAPLAQRLDELAGVVNATTKKNKELEATVKELRVKFAAQEVTLKELTADTPRAVAKEKRASQTDATVTTKDASVPSTDPYISSFISEFIMAPQRGQ